MAARQADLPTPAGLPPLQTGLPPDSNGHLLAKSSLAFSTVKAEEKARLLNGASSSSADPDVRPAPFDGGGVADLPMVDIPLDERAAKDAGPANGGALLNGGHVSSFELQAAVKEADVIHKVHWHVLPVFFCLALLNAMDRANLSFAAIQFDYDLHFSNTVYGIGAGVFFLGYATFQVPSTFVCAWMGGPTFLGLILLAWGLTASLFSCVANEAGFITARFFLGLAESGAYPGMWYHLYQFYNDKELGLVYTIVSTRHAAVFTCLSGVFGGPIAAGILQMDGAAGLHGWQWLFILEGLPALLLGIYIMFFLARSPASAVFLTPDERAWLVARQAVAKVAPRLKDAVPPPETATPAPEQPDRWWPIFKVMIRSWRIWWIGAIWAFVSMGMDSLIFFLPIIINDVFHSAVAADDTVTFDQSEEQASVTWRAVQAALLSAIPFGSASIGMVINAWHAKRTGERHWHVAGSLLLGAAACVAFLLLIGHVDWLAFIALTVAAVGIWSVHGPLLSWPAVILNGTAAASGFALIKMLGALAAFVGNYVFGAFSSDGKNWTGVMALLAGVLFLGAVMTLFFREPGTPPEIASAPLKMRMPLYKRSRSDRARQPHVSLTAVTPKVADGERVDGERADAAARHIIHTQEL